MKISSLGEFELIKRIEQNSSKGGSPLANPSAIGIGDDCAVIRHDEIHSQLVTTDMLIEDVHFLRRAIAARDLGHKSLAVNLSDIAAMGGQPQSAFLSLGLPPDVEVAWIDSFIEGFNALAEDFGVRLLGGDTARSPQCLVINVAIFGNIQNDRVKLRSSAQHKDFICVTGNLGDSAAGLKAIREDRALDSELCVLVEQHHRPRPHVRQGRWLAKHPEVRAMMDVSDGIDSDLKRIMERSRCGAMVYVERLPISAHLKSVHKRMGWNPTELATVGGEDYCLLLTVDPVAYDRLARDYNREFGSPLFCIGEITDQIGELVYHQSGEPYSLRVKGFEHFPKSASEGKWT